MKAIFINLCIGILIFSGCKVSHVIQYDEYGLVAHYSFDNKSIIDSSSYHIDAVLDNIEFTSDRFGNTNSAVMLNGENSKVECGRNNRRIKDKLTVMAWVKTTAGDLPAVVSKYDWHEDKGYSLRLREQGEAAIEGRDGNNKYQQSGFKTSLYDYQWHHIVGVINKNNWTIYVDGNKVSSSTNTNKYVNLSNTSILTFGALPIPNGKGNFRYFNGSIDEVLMFNEAMNDDVIKSIYRMSKTKSL